MTLVSLLCVVVGEVFVCFNISVAAAGKNEQLVNAFSSWQSNLPET